MRNFRAGNMDFHISDVAELVSTVACLDFSDQ